MKSLKIALSISGILLILAGLIWAAQGRGYFPYPVDSFMINQTKWVSRGLVTAVVGFVMLFLARRF